MNMELPDRKKKSFKRFLNSFKYSFAGLKHAYKNEQSMMIHFIAVILVVSAGLILKLTLIEWLIVFILMGLVLATELINTSLEAVVDLISPNKNYLAKIAKDTASAAVFIFSLVAFISGLIIFIPKIIEFIGG